MISSEQWQSLIYLKKSDFNYPDKLKWDLVRKMDYFIGQVGSKPIFLDDWRDDEKEHGKGNAIDTTWIGVDPLVVNQLAFDSGLWSGIGLYFNDAGVASHHFDIRSDRSPDNPASWGGIITHPFDSFQNAHIKKIEYMSIGYVIESIKKKGLISIAFLIVSLFTIWIYKK